MSQVGQQISRVHHSLASSPIILWFLGLLSGFFWTCATLVQIQTSEYLALGNQSRVAGVAWGVLQQPYLLFTGQVPPYLATAYLYGWVVETITLVYALAFSVAITKVSASHPKMAKVFIILGFLLIILNGYSDFSASPGTTPLVQGLVALAIGIIVVWGLPLAIGLIEHGFDEL